MKIKSNWTLLPRSIYRRTALAFLGLMMASGVLSTIGFYLMWRGSQAGTEQIVQWDVANHLARELEPKIAERVDPVEILRVFYNAMEFNPRLDPYLLKLDGTIEYALDERFQNLHIDPEPIKTFINQRGFPENPIIGDFPGATAFPIWREPLAFSAAQIRTADGPRYLYVTFQNFYYRHARQGVLDREGWFAAAMFFLALASASTVVGGVLFWYLTRNLVKITDTVRKYAAGDYMARVAVASRDEFGELASTFNHMAEKITATVEELKRIDQSRRELIAGISHDMRHPIAVMYSSLDLLRSRLKSANIEEKADLVEQSQRACSGLKLQLDDLLELSTLNSPEMKLVEDAIWAGDLVQEIVLQQRSIAQGKGVVLEANFPDVLPEVRGDIRLIARALLNLISNAIRYTPKGGRVDVFAGEVPGGVEFSVRDTGIGIPEQELSNVLEPYMRGSNARNIQGTGLGLAITNQIVKLHGSSIQLESRVGTGTTVRFVLNTPRDQGSSSSFQSA